MATIDIDKPRLAEYNDNVTVVRVAVNSSGTAFARNDIVTISGSGADKLEASGANATAMALAVEASSDSYVEPIVGQAQGEPTTLKQVARLGEGVLLEMSTNNNAISQSNIGTAYDLDYDTTNATMVVDITTTANASFRILRLADEQYGGSLGDSQVRVVGVVLDANAF